MQFASEIIFIRVLKRNVLFSTSQHKEYLEPIDSLKLDYGGVVKEFPDLKDNKEWRLEAIARFKDKIRDLDNEEEVYKYVLEDLKKFGYVPLKRQKAGFRAEVIK